MTTHEQSWIGMIDVSGGTVEDRMEMRLLPHSWRHNGTLYNDIHKEASHGIFVDRVGEGVGEGVAIVCVSDGAANVVDDAFGVADEASNTLTAPTLLVTDL